MINCWRLTSRVTSKLITKLQKRKRRSARQRNIRSVLKTVDISYRFSLQLDMTGCPECPFLQSIKMLRTFPIIPRKEVEKQVTPFSQKCTD